MAMGIRLTRAVVAGILAATAALGTARTAAAEEFYTLASVQRVTVRGGVAVRLSANGPVAFATMPDPGAPPGVQRVRLRLYGVNASAVGVHAAVDGAAVSASADARGNLDVVVTAMAGLDAGRPFDVRMGANPNEVDVVLRPATP